MKKKENILSIVPSSHKVSEEEIRLRAHQIWLRDGQPHGRDREHWLQAERDLTSPTKVSVNSRSENETKKPRSKKM